MDICNVRSLYMSQSVTTMTRELARYRLYIVGVRDFRWENGCTVRVRDFNFKI
jgi:hypothetical protein